MPDAGFSITWRAFHRPKRGHGDDEYEDAFAVNLEAGQFAVADGASESSFAGLWARLLVEEFVRPFHQRERLEPLRKSWAAEVDGRSLPWYAEEKRRQGALATFCGLTIRPPRRPTGGGWRAIAIGDSCLFQVHDGTLVTAFPLTRSTEFSNQPPLLGSRPSLEALSKLWKLRRGRWQSGDRFFLMTDALAEWFLRQNETEQKPWEKIGTLQAEADAGFAAWVEEQRDLKELRNDDVTLIVIDV